MPEPRRRTRGVQPRGQIDTILSRSPQCVSVHADGVWGGLTPKLQIAIGFFTEQFGVPTKVTYQLPEELPGKLHEIGRQGGGMVQRDIQAQVFMSLDTAKSLAEWLNDKVVQGQNVLQQQAGTAPTALDSTDAVAQPPVMEAKDAD